MNTKSYLYLIRLKVNRISRLDFIEQTWCKLEGSSITPNGNVQEVHDLVAVSKRGLLSLRRQIPAGQVNNNEQE